MINEKILVPAIFAAFILLEAITGRFLQKEKGSSRDVVIEVLSSLTIVLITVPLIALLAWHKGALIVRIAPRNRLLVTLRVAAEVGATVGFLTALKHMPLANVTAILQVLPLTVTMAAALFLGENVGWRRWLAITIGLAGVMIIIRPGMEGFSVYSIWALVAVVVAMSTSVRTVTIVRGDGVRASEKAAKMLAERVSVVGDSVDAMAAALDARGPSTAKRDRESAALRKDLDALVKQVKAHDATIAKVKKQKGGGAAPAPAEVVDHGKDIAALHGELEKLAKQKTPTPAPAAAPVEVNKADLTQLRRELLKEIADVASQSAAAAGADKSPEVSERVTSELDELRRRLDMLASIPYPVPDNSKADKTDIEELRRELGKLASEAKGTKRHSKAGKEVADEVRAQMELFRADRTGLVDYAMFSGGGKVVGHSTLAPAVAKGDGPLTNALKGESKTQGTWGEVFA